MATNAQAGGGVHVRARPYETTAVDHAGFDGNNYPATGEVVDFRLERQRGLTIRKRIFALANDRLPYAQRFPTTVVTCKSSVRDVCELVFILHAV